MNRSSVFESFLRFHQADSFRRQELSLAKDDQSLVVDVQFEMKKMFIMYKNSLNFLVHCEWCILQQCIASAFETNILRVRSDCLKSGNWCFFPLQYNGLLVHPCAASFAKKARCVNQLCTINYSPNLNPRIKFY